MITAAFAALLIVSGCASPQRPISKPGQQFSGPDYITEARRSVEPFAHVMFCTRTPGECARSRNVAAVALTADKLNALTAINSSVNRQISPKSDQGDDVWTLSPASGDCEDYAVTKRHALIQRGWPASALKLAIGKTGTAEGHLVLVVRTTKGDVVLDNRSNEIQNWQDVDLAWQSIQSSANPRVWHKIALTPLS